MCWQCWSTQACSRKEEQFVVSQLCCKDKTHFVQSSGWLGELQWLVELGWLTWCPQACVFSFDVKPNAPLHIAA